MNLSCFNDLRPGDIIEFTGGARYTIHRQSGLDSYQVTNGYGTIAGNVYRHDCMKRHDRPAVICRIFKKGY